MKWNYNVNLYLKIKKTINMGFKKIIVKFPN